MWVNPDAAAKELIRLEVETKCQDDQVFARIRAFTKCTPRDCKWGWTKAELRDGGGLRVLLIGFLSSKIIDVRKIGENLDAFVTNITNDGSQPERLKSYSLKRL
ncbi:serine/threonine protein kinase [Labrenzia polysiphoniae]|uniref:Serine/threonine protein kinase n=1 Tax=Roseibium polysiphoniae TaxID=2571221 RepID=A0ABR9CFT4_9HYPH|nr:serine/threonine protein kinase [Roseibium polysiphoniae]